MSATNQITNPETAKAVLAAAKENAVWEAGIPSDEAKLLKDATFVYDQSVTAWNNGMRGKAVTAVKFAAEVTGAHEGKSIETEDDETTAVLSQTVAEIKKDIDLLIEQDLEAVQALLDAEQAGKARKGVINYIEQQLNDAFKEPDESGELESGDRGENHGSGSVSPWAGDVEPPQPNTLDKAGYKKSKFNELFEAEEFARAEAKKLNLPVPEKVDDIPSATLSRGVANLTVQELAERLTDSSLCLAAATWQTALAEIDEEHAERVGNHYYNIEYAKAAPNAKNVAEASAKAEEVEEVKKWRNAEAEAHSRYLSFRALKEVYKGTYDTISRVFAMKQEANERHR